MVYARIGFGGKPTLSPPLMLILLFKLFLFWRLGLFLVTYLGSLVFPKIANGGLGSIGPGRNFDFWASWAQWDGGHYFKIARDGYELFSDYAFFPLYPLITRLVNWFLSDNLILAGLLVSNLSFLVFLYVFFNLVSQRFSSKIAFSSLVTLLVFPTTFYAVAYYSESLFLLWLSLTLLFLSKRAYLVAAISSSLASLTRPLGIILIIPLFYGYFAHRQFHLKRVDRKLLHIFIALFGFAVYSLYLFAHFNDPVKFLSIQSSWERQVTDPISNLISYLWAFLRGESRPFNDYSDFGLTILFLVILILGIKRIPATWWIFSMLVILIPVSGGTLTSMPRYLLSTLGAFIILGQYLEKHPNLKLPLWTISLVAQAVAAIRFISGFWVA